MYLSKEQISQMIDLSAVRAEDDDQYIQSLVDCAQKYHCIAIYTLPSRIQLAKELLSDRNDVILGGAVGFPSGGNTTAVKVFEAKELINLGCREIDMVINISNLISGLNKEVQEDIHAVVESANGIPVKVILECHYLSDVLILKACDMSINAGAKWVKTSTGWTPTGATSQNVSLIRSHVGDTIGIKAAGGIRDLKKLIELYRCGARRFGVGLTASIKILEQAFSLPGGKIEV